MTQPVVCHLDSLNQAVTQRDISSPGKEVFENAVDDCLQQMSDMQLNKVHTFSSPFNLISLMLSE